MSWVTSSVVTPQLTLQGADVGAHLVAQPGVEVAQRFVEQQQPRPDHQRPRQGDTLLLAAGQLRRKTMREIAKANQGQCLPHPFGDFPLADAAHLQAEGHVGEGRHVRKQGVVLEHHRHVAGVHRRRGDVAPVQHDAAAIGRVDAGDGAQNGGLAAAGRTQQGEELTLRDRKVDALHGENGPERFFEAADLQRHSGGHAAAAHFAEVISRWNRSDHSVRCARTYG